MVERMEDLNLSDLDEMGKMNANLARPKMPEFNDNQLRPARFSHIVLQTNNLKPMVDFYMNVVGCKAVWEAPIGAFLTFDDEHHRVLIIENPTLKAKQKNRNGMVHFAFLFDSLEDLNTAYKRIRDEENIVPAYCENHGFQIGYYYLDPDGNECELGCDVFENHDQLNEYFASGLFNTQPVGMKFNPDYVSELIDEGVDPKHIMENKTYKDVYEPVSFKQLIDEGAMPWFAPYLIKIKNFFNKADSK
tara:strand:+ start:1249 stop:1989 length:741 start_codon:yes stop_codon:yes gene_type:complete